MPVLTSFLLHAFAHVQAFAQVPDLHVYYGPDTYMGRNLGQLFTMLAALPDEEVAAVHPAHTAASVRALLPRLHCFQEGTCIVHHMFGAQTTELVRRAYGDALLTAHFEVPGEMFTLAMDARRRDAGVVGSTQNILDFIAAKLRTALELPFPERLQARGQSSLPKYLMLGQTVEVCANAGGAGDGVGHDHVDRAQGAGDAAREWPLGCERGGCFPCRPRCTCHRCHGVGAPGAAGRLGHGAGRRLRRGLLH